ncbi:immunoglobulin-like domain-containing protein [Halobacillus faecis]
MLKTLLSIITICTFAVFGLWIYESMTTKETSGNPYSDTIPSQMGEPDSSEYMFTERFPYTEEEIFEKTGYGPKTGEGFNSSNMIAPIADFQINHPGEEQGTYIEGIPEGHTVKVELIERTKELKKIDKVKEVTYEEGEKGLVTTLPNKRDQLYSLSAEMINRKGEVIDTYVGIVYVPPEPEVNAEVSIDKTSYSPTDTMDFRITNFGPSRLSYGARFIIQSYENEAWKTVEGPEAVVAMEYILLPKESTVHTVKLESYDLEKGKHRIIKRLGVSDTEVEEGLAATFIVE